MEIKPLTGNWTTRCCTCGKEYQNGVGSTECCGSLQEIVSREASCLKCEQIKGQLTALEAELSRVVETGLRTEKQLEGFHSELGQARREAVCLAASIWRSEYKADAPNWAPLETVAGVISQIDNMYAGVRAQRDEARFALNQARDRINAKDVALLNIQGSENLVRIWDLARLASLDASGDPSEPLEITALRAKCKIKDEALTELLKAMHEYEFEVDDEPTFKHRSMMERARAALNTP